MVVGEKPIREDDIAVVPLGKATVKLGERGVEVLSYSITAGVLPDQENGPLGRVYFAVYDVDLDAQAAALVRTAGEGDGAGSADFLNDFFSDGETWSRTALPRHQSLSPLPLAAGALTSVSARSRSLGRKDRRRKDRQ